MQIKAALTWCNRALPAAMSDVVVRHVGGAANGSGQAGNSVPLMT
ncbi:hypothetical protein PATSB16_23890 [Pandoraea thiooxydans]|nr:hypothetical protein PATSB16_23890 [Pandoraea thiooxydans]